MKLEGCEMGDSLRNCTHERCRAESFAPGQFECSAPARFRRECAKASGENARAISVASHVDWRWRDDVRAWHRTATLDDSVCSFRLDQRSKSKSSWLWNLGDVHLLAEPRLDPRRLRDRGREMGGVRGEAAGQSCLRNGCSLQLKRRRNPNLDMQQKL